MLHMPKSKKPKKAYKPKYPEGQIPIVFRHGAEADRMLQHIPHEDLERLRRGEADEYAVNTLIFRLNWGYVMSGEVFDNPEVRAAMETGLKAIRSVKERADRLGRYGATGEEFFAIGEALNWTDGMQKASTRREQEQAMKSVFLINDYLQEK